MLVRRKAFALLAGVTMVTLGACMPVAPVASTTVGLVPSQSEEATVSADAQVLEFDVAEDMTRFVFNKDVAYEDGMPADGSSFITRGYIYEPGTLDGTNGVNADGS